ncbi:MAG: HPF/RaiA family ribosome-associated protein [Alphaproteobacteria bacterium]
MTFPIEVAFQDLEHSDAIEARVRERARRLDRFHERIVNCRAVVRRLGSRQHKGNLYEVRIEISVPGSSIFVNRNPGDRNAHEDVYVAIRDSFEAAVRQLEDHVRKSSGHRAKVHHTPHQGTVERLFAEEGYGFIRTPDGREVYFHRNALVEGGWERIEVGTAVRFTEEPGDKGPHAHNVSLHD